MDGRNTSNMEGKLYASKMHNLWKSCMRRTRGKDRYGSSDMLCNRCYRESNKLYELKEDYYKNRDEINEMESKIRKRTMGW